MNRKFFNLLLMGALAVTAIGSVSSCKDYDDDINNLQDQINKVALQTSVDELKTQLANVKSTAESAQADATSALAKALGAQTAADNAQDAADNAQSAADKAQTDATAAQTAADAALNSAIAALPAEQGEAVKKALEELQETTTKNAADVDAKIKAAADAAAAAAEAAAAAQNAADAANTAAGNAQSTADAANTAAGNAQNAADKAQSDADKANTAAGNAQSTADKAAADAAAAQAAAEAAAAKATTAEAAAKAAADAAEAAKTYADAQIDAKIAALDETLAGLDNKEEVLSALSRLAKIEEDYTTAAKLQAALSELESKIGAATTQAEIAGLKSDVAAYKGGIDALFTAVTGVEVVGSYTLNGTSYSNAADVTITCGSVGANYTFGKADQCYDYSTSKKVYTATPNQTYTKGDVFSYSDGELLVRVNPTNMKLTADMIKFIDSQGNDLKGVIGVVKVEEFNGLLTRGTNKTGLWKVTLKSNKDVKGITDATTVKVGGTSKNIAYAIAVNNTAADVNANAADRYVVSGYDVAFKTTTYSAPTDLKNVTLRAASEANAETIESRSKISVNNGEEFYVSFATAKMNDFEYFYVVRDDKYSSGDDELRAWESYEYADVLGKVTPVNHGDSLAMKVTIPSRFVKGDEVKFRIFAISYDAMQICQKAFTVYVGADKVIEDITGELKAVSHETMETGRLAITNALKSNSLTNSVKVKNADGEEVELSVAYYKTADATSSTTTVADAKFVQFSCNTAASLQKLADGGDATGVLEFKDVNGIVTNTINVSLTKVMPTAADVDAFYKEAGMTWKAEQRDKNGVYTAYLYPESNVWTTSSSYGTLSLDKAFTDLPESEYTFLTIADAALGKEDAAKKKSYNADMTVAWVSDAWKLQVPTAADDYKTKLIDNEKEHDAVFGYNFGKISSVKVNSAYVDYKLNASSSDYSFKIIFANPLNESVQTYAWAKKNIGTEDEPEYVDVNVLKIGNAIPVNLDYSGIGANYYNDQLSYYLRATNSYDPKTFSGHFAKVGNAGNDCLRYTRYMKDVTGTKYATAKLISDETGKEDYFTASIDKYGWISFTPVENPVTPKADVKSWLVLNLTDCFGDTHEYKLPFTVLK